jgi:hypothetical protein
VQRFDWDASAARLEHFLQLYRADPNYYREGRVPNNAADVD